MSEPADFGGLVDSEQALEREADRLAERFPKTAREEIGERLHAAYEDLGEDAKVRSRLVTVAGSEVAEELREEGSPFHPSTSDDDASTSSGGLMPRDVDEPSTPDVGSAYMRPSMDDEAERRA